MSDADDARVVAARKVARAIGALQGARRGARSMRTIATETWLFVALMGFGALLVSGALQL
jgi:hypothetical protein